MSLVAASPKDAITSESYMDTVYSCNRGARAAPERGHATESWALVSVRQPCQVLFQPLLLGGVGGFGEPVGELEELTLLPLLRVEARFDEVSNDAVGADPFSFGDFIHS